MSFQSTLIDTPTVGLEDLQRAAFYAFFEGMNNALIEIADYWAPRDAEFDIRTGNNFAPTVLEPIPNSNFFEGHKPSLILGGPGGYPNIAVFAMQADSNPESDRFDQIDSWLDSLLVEVMVKAINEETVNRRIHRTTEAAIMCLRRNPTLGRAITGFLTVPNIVISDVFAVRSPSQGGAYPGQSGASTDRYIWQGSQIKFKIPKDAIQPASGSGAFSEASTVDYGANIDQG